MKIINLKINEFGKLKNKEIQLQEKINIIHGKNESGKSTLLKFITSILYGLSKNKNGKPITDYDKYTPWEEQNFSGKIKYKLDNQKQYEIFREFKKKNPKIFNENLEDISQEFNIDKTKGNQFFYDQTKVEEELFLSTIVVEQEALKLEEKEQTNLIQKLSNLASTGEDNLSFQKIINKLNKKQLEEIGTKKSQDRPINLAIEKIENLQKEKEDLKQYQNRKYEIEEIQKQAEKEINKQEEKLKLQQKIKEIKNQYELKQEKLEINKVESSNLKKQIEELKKQIETLEEKNNKNNSKKNNKIKNIFIPIFILISILSILFLKNKIIKFIPMLSTIVYGGVLYYINKKEKMGIKKEQKQKEKEKEKIKSQIEILEEKRKEQLQQILIVENEMLTTLQIEKEKIKNTQKVEMQEIEEIFKQENIEEQITKTQNNINNIKLKIHSLALDNKNNLEKLENLAKIEEELITQKQYYYQLQQESQMISIAKEEIEKAYQEMKQNITPRFAMKLSEIIEKISNGKYKNIQFNDEKGLIVEIENGNYISAQNLSMGTIDQLYLSLRLSTIEEIAKEKLPIMLDEAFAYFDDTRLENILQYINQQYQDRQIIIFTCTNREKEILEKLNITYNLIEM